MTGPGAVTVTGAGSGDWRSFLPTKLTEDTGTVVVTVYDLIVQFGFIGATTVTSADLPL